MSDTNDSFAERAEDRDLRPDADACYKCSTCNTECPVAAVDDEFPGPKFQGPEQWRLTQKDDYTIDSSIDACSNCMRCDTACPAGVPLSKMHNTLRARVAADRGVSRKGIRDRLLANYGRLARFASRVPRLSNWVVNARPVRWLLKELLGITHERSFPRFATETFTEWWSDRGGPRFEDETKRVAYFHGDYANFNTPDVGKALVRVFEAFGYEVAVPPQRCSGTPMFANGAIKDARRAARFNIETFRALVDQGYDIVCSCTSCSFALRQEYPELFDITGTARVAEHTFEAIEYLRIHEALNDRLAASSGGAEFAYHAPCHARNQGLAGQAVEVLNQVDGVSVTDVGDSCSGISGTYGWKDERYEVSMAIGEEMFAGMREAPAETGLTECPTCANQMEHGTGYEITHPLEVLESIIVDVPVADASE